MNVLLVYPEMPDTFYAMKHMNDVVDKKATYPPLGLLTIAPMLPGSWNKKLIDSNVQKLTKADLVGIDYVLISAMNVQEQSVREIIKLCQQSNVKTIAGGPLFTHEHARFPEIDYFVLNEAEITLPPFLEDLEKGTPKRIYESSAYADISLTPIPDLSLVDMSKYLFSIVQYSRGCPYMCDFCDVTALFGRKPRTKTSEHMISELDAINKLDNIDLILFADDNLIGNKKILKSDLLPALIEWRKRVKPSFFFATQLTINIVDDKELMQLMLDAGFRHIFIGIETPDEEALKVSSKKQNLKRDQLENIKVLHQAGFIISAGFIVGFDTDTTSIFKQQVDFIQESGIPLPIVNILKAPPGTELFDRIKKEGRLSKPFAFSEGDTNITPTMDERDLYTGFIDLITNIYTPEKSYERIINFLNGYGGAKSSVKISQKLTGAQIKMALSIFFKLGIIYSERKYFWKLVLWTLKNKPKQVEMAFFYSVMIYQMHLTFEHIKKGVEKNISEIKEYDKLKEAI